LRLHTTQRFFLSAISSINENYPALFDTRTKSEGDGGGESGGDIDNFVINFGWLSNAKMVAEFEAIPLEQVWNLGVIHFLNDLLYIKMKNKADAEQYKNSTK